MSERWMERKLVLREWRARTPRFDLPRVPVKVKVNVSLSCPLFALPAFVATYIFPASPPPPRCTCIALNIRQAKTIPKWKEISIIGLIKFFDKEENAEKIVQSSRVFINTCVFLKNTQQTNVQKFFEIKKNKMSSDFYAMKRRLKDWSKRHERPQENVTKLPRSSTSQSFSITISLGIPTITYFKLEKKHEKADFFKQTFPRNQ